MILNFKKCHFMCIDRHGENETFTFKDVSHKTVRVILGIAIDNKFNFDRHIRCVKNLVKN